MTCSRSVFPSTRLARAGDEVTVEVEGLGRLENTLVPEEILWWGRSFREAGPGDLPRRSTRCHRQGDGLRLDDGSHVTEDEVWLPPVEPRTIFAVGLNYARHAREIKSAPRQEPLVFLKGPNSVAGHPLSTPVRPA